MIHAYVVFKSLHYLVSGVLGRGQRLSEVDLFCSSVGMVYAVELVLEFLFLDSES